MNSIESNLIIYGINNDQKGKTFKVEDPIVVGRSLKCDVFIADGMASREQALFYRNPDGSLMVEDLGSSNGTFLNGKRITSVKLQQGDVVRLGSTKFGVRSRRSSLTVELVDPIQRQKTRMVKQVSKVKAPSLHRVQHTLLADFDPTSGNVEELQRKTRNLATLFEISQLIQKHDEMDELLSMALDVLMKAPGGDEAHVVFTGDNDAFVPYVSKDLSGHSSSGKLLLSKTVVEYVLKEKCGVLAPDLQNDLRFAGSESILYGSPGSILAAPIIMNQKAKGLIAICSRNDKKQPVEADLDLLCVSANMLGAALDNLELRKEIEETQKEVLFTMGAIGETRSKETGNHVKRVAEYSRLLAKLFGLSDHEAELLKQASPMHDIGKVGIPDRVLNKPGKLNADEWEIMKTHAQLGYDMLKHSKRPILQAAAIVAQQHHEKWDGSGYPKGLAGEDIHIYGRITSVADVFDALGSERCYKRAWPLDKIVDFFKAQKEKHFDPKLVELLFSNIQQFLYIRDQYKDEYLGPN